MRIINVLFFAMLCPLLLSAQSGLKDFNPEGGLFLGVANYQGDFTVKTAPEITESNVALGLTFRYPFSHKYAVRANMFYGKITGNDRNFDIREQRGASFQTSMVEFSVTGEWEPFGQNRTDLTLDIGQRMSPYFFAGLGMTYVRPKTIFGNKDDARAIKDKNAEFSQIQPVIPMGLGLRMGINDMMSLSAELGMRKTFTDFLDGISYSGKTGTDDWYLFGGIMFLYQIQ